MSPSEAPVHDHSPDIDHQWEHDGIAHIRGALSASEVQRVLGRLDPLIDSATEGRSSSTRIEHAVEYSGVIDSLLDHSAVFPMLVRFLGKHLTLLGSDVFARHAHTSNQPLHELHMDGGPSLWQVALPPRSACLTLRVQFFLTDVDEPDNGTFTYVAGSHRLQPTWAGDDVVFPSDVVVRRKRQLLARAGDAVSFSWCLWHAVAPNCSSSGRVRKSVILRYGQLWTRPNHSGITQQTLDRMTERQRRICGDLGHSPNPIDWYFPPEQARIILGSGHDE